MGEHYFSYYLVSALEKTHEGRYVLVVSLLKIGEIGHRDSKYLIQGTQERKGPGLELSCVL